MHVNPRHKKRKKRKFYLDSNDFGFICSGVSNVGGYKRSAWYNLSCLLQAYCPVTETSVSWQFFKTYGSGWRKAICCKPVQGLTVEKGLTTPEWNPQPYLELSCRSRGRLTQEVGSGPRRSLLRLGTRSGFPPWGDPPRRWWCHHAPCQPWPRPGAWPHDAPLCTAWWAGLRLSLAPSTSASLTGCPRRSLPEVLQVRMEPLPTASGHSIRGGKLPPKLWWLISVKPMLRWNCWAGEPHESPTVNNDNISRT